MRAAYAISAWCSFTNKEQQGQIDAFLKRSHRFGFTRRLFTFAQIAERADRTLASSTANPNHCIHQLLLPARPEHIHFRGRVHPYTLPTCTFDLFKNSFINRCLFSFI